MKIPRIIFNFNDTCLNGCPFCFIPFDQKGCGTLNQWVKILSRINEFSPDMISFSGCDPLYYDDFYELLRKMPKSSAWGIDTSLIFLNRKKFPLIADKVDLFSTSVDDVSEMQIKQRYTTPRLKQFWDNFDYVHNFFPNIMVHTLYSIYNADYLTDIADTLLLKGVKTWSLYQFWPFDFHKNPERYLISESVFNSAGQRLSDYCSGKIDFEYVPYRGRANGYLFVSSLGNAYTTLGGDIGRYLSLGSIFDDDIIEKWNKFSNPDKSTEILKLKLKRETKRKG